MRVIVNGQEEELEEGTDLAALLLRLNMRVEAVAVAVNLEVVPRRSLAHTTLRTGDRVEIVRAVGGG